MAKKDAEKKKKQQAQTTTEEEEQAQASQTEDAAKDTGEAKQNGEEKEGSQDIEKLQSEIKDLKEQLLRNQAELQNFKRRMQDERIRDRKYANAELMKAILPVLDNFEIALKKETENGHGESSLQGFEMIHRELRKALETNGLERIEAEGETFDPNYHQAVATDPRDDVDPGVVTEELQAGYLLKDRLLRPAMVRVSESKTDEETQTNGNEANEKESVS